MTETSCPVAEESNAGRVPPVGELSDLETVGESLEQETETTPKVRKRIVCRTLHKSVFLDRKIVFKSVKSYVIIVQDTSRIQTTKRQRRFDSAGRYLDAVKWISAKIAQSESSHIE